MEFIIKMSGVKNILYIHGFMSSPQSYKAELTKRFIQKYYPSWHYYCPQLHVSPAIAIEQLIALMKDKQDQTWLLIGSSLGGYYGSYLSEKFNVKAVLVNPAVKPYELLEAYLGEQKSYHSDEVVNVKPCFLDELKNIEVNTISKKNYLVMLQTDDEVLDYQQAEKKYQSCELVIEQGGDHSFINFQDHLPDIMQNFSIEYA